jgi:lipopolysaccharide biosynthesis regulator YciM
VTLGDIARILVSKGEVDEALRMHQEMLTVFERLGDARSLAIGNANLAMILYERPEADARKRAFELMMRSFEAASKLQLAEANSIGTILLRWLNEAKS